MHLSSFIVSATALLAALAHALPVTDTSESTAVLSADDILKLDTGSGCLDSALNSISAQNREAIGSVAHELNNTVFRDFHQFGPVALALGKPDIQEKIVGNDYPTTIAGLRELRSLIDSDIPSVAKSASSSKSGCGAPTAQNLQVVYTNLDKLLQQFN
ncbi:hypothetical protein IW140_002815 [Coemansia sp. RSA 1813]|nr:hypothetical protein EV178_002735 [Coemansia sp. RSA 1646]KAJ1770094.1 hypothetical protein LPJ74_003455 [Coemansia sp. RSA 1843]KAJ2089868.1 hypothetical protein IW138_003162 [Coemansia sp. RSA 986]KAJ2214747.1 hypothetical protein EV179_002695 [Coemansia sp. RSA 487]KAJ2569734.1 hypothetical protein IW140_002815 [Coemansia sp. RSA 1813]